MKISEYFDSKKRESQKLVEELAEHMATWPSVKAEYDRIDLECVELAGKLAAAKLAGSPTALELEAQLKRLRWRRDDGKQRFSIKRDAYQRQLEAITREPIHKFHMDALDIVQNLAKLYRYERLEPSHNLEGRRVRHGVLISHNAAALSKSKDQIFETIAEVNGMKYSALADVEKRIFELRNELSNLEFSTMEVEEVTEQTANDMKPGHESGVTQNATLMPDHSLWVHDVPDSGRVSQLSDRISRLEKSL